MDTYESTKARESTLRQPDKIHWDNDRSFRDQPYRQLHHQRGVMGVFRIRLLEAADLQRSYWSALALGPVKHLGLSKAHGETSSFCSFTLVHDEPKDRSSNLDRKPSARAKAMVSPVIPTSNNPVWDNCQFECPLVKGRAPTDGLGIRLSVRVDEDATALDNFVPGAGGDGRMLGTGELDLTDLCRGENGTGQALPGVRDAWIPIALPAEAEQEFSELLDPLQQKPKKGANTGKVRVLVTYEPIGLEPQAHDIVALESFARRNLATASCRPTLEPLMPLTVLERRGSYLLCEYLLPGTNRKKACIRLHRNAVFVIERQNIKDAAHNLVLLPFDVVMATPLGQTAGRLLGPTAAAGRELVMPAFLSFKLVWMAAKTTTLAGFSGVQALGSTFWEVGTSSLTATHRERQQQPDGLAQFVQL